MTVTTFVHGNTIRANDIRQHYLRFGGKGQPLVLVPGIVSPAILWEFVGQRLGQVYDVYILDVRGRGLSETGDTLDYSLDAYAADVAGFAKAMGFGKFVMMGHSMGARIAIRTARKYGDMLNSIVLVDPPVSGPGRRAYPIPVPLPMLDKAQRGELWEATKDNSTWTEYSTRIRAEWMHTCNRVAVETTYRNFHEEDIFSDLPHIKVPAALIVAGKGGVIQAPDVQEMQQLAPDLVVEYVESAGHMIPFEDLEAFLATAGKILGTSF